MISNHSDLIRYFSITSPVSEGFAKATEMELTGKYTRSLKILQRKCEKRSARAFPIVKNI
jgi:hypothetical protein